MTHPAYCAICTRTIFYPLAKLLTGTNLCLKCHIKIELNSEKWNAGYLFRKLRSKYHCFGVLHQWYTEKGFIPYDLNKAPTFSVRCSHCLSSKQVKRQAKEQEALDAIVYLCGTRNVLRGKS